MPHFLTLPVQRPPRSWLSVFLAVAMVSPVVGVAAEEDFAVVASMEKREIGYAKSTTGRTPVRAFATGLGVYELDSTIQRVRVWKRGGNAAEVLSGGFSGRDATKAGTPFRTPVGLAKHPDEDKFAVVCGGSSPSIQVYNFTETSGANGVLSAVDIAFDNIYSNSVQVVTNGVSWDIDSVDASLVTNFVHVTDAGLVTNAVPADLEGGETELPSDPVAAGLDYKVGDVWTAGTSTVYSTNYVVRYSTSLYNCLANATDVAFAGDAALIVSVSGDERYGVIPGLVVFDATDPAAPGKRVSVTNLPFRISGIDVDPGTGDVYAAVPGLHAVYRVPAPVSGDPGSWYSSFGDEGSIEADSDPVFGVRGESSSDWPYLSNPVGVSLWKPASLDERILLAVDDATARVFATRLDGAPLFYVASVVGASLVRPSSVCGIDGEDAFAVADTGNRRVLVGLVDGSAFEGGDDPPAEVAVYSAIFTAMSPTNLSFRVTCVSGTPAAGDTVSLHASANLSTPPVEWPLATGASQTSFPVGTDLSAAGDTREYGPIEIPSGETSIFFSVHAP